MKRITFGFRIAATILFLCAAMLPYAASAGLSMRRDGWVSWQVPAIADAPNWCCFGDWRKGNPNSEKETCQLDGADHGYGTNSADSTNSRNETTDSIRVYARFDGGKLAKLRAFAASCAVKANSVIMSLENVSVEASAKWLVNFVKANVASQGSNASSRTRSSDVMAALALHQGNIARDALADFARNDPRVEHRKEAMFWLTQLRGEEGALIVAPLMFSDADAAAREHAAFAIAQTKSPLTVPNLIRQGNTDRDAQVRAQAWFWLSQTKASEAEGAIRASLQTEKESHVRDQAVFALSQLPADRASRALIALAEDKSLPRHDRKQAIFWLGQMKSDAAVLYLDKLLSATAQN
jgi:HEAT repeats